MKFIDAVALSGTRRTSDGYLVADVRTARTGIQLYAGHEVGKPDMPLVRVYRAEDQVFAKASLGSYAHKPITLDHPAEEVTAANWKDLAVGQIGDEVARDGEFVRIPLSVMDAGAIGEVEGGKNELSAGYSCELDWTPGTTNDGQAFDAQQKNIRINHVAIVQSGRAGSQARIGDGAISWGAIPIPSTDQRLEREKIMTLKTIQVDGIPVEVTDQGATVIATLQSRLADADKKITDADAAHAVAIAAKDAELAKKDAALDAEKAKVLSDADLDKRVSARADLIAKATTIAKDVKTEGLTDAAIRKAVVTAALGDDAVKDKADAYIDARFDILVEDAGKADVDPFRAVVAGGIKSTDAATVADAAWSKGVSDLNAWRKEA